MQQNHKSKLIILNEYMKGMADWGIVGPLSDIQIWLILSLSLVCCSYFSLHAVTALVHSNSPFQAFQAHSQRKGSGRLEACSLVKYLNYFIDVSTVINLPVALPSSWPVSGQPCWGIVKELSDGGWWGSCVFEAVCFDSWGDYTAVVNSAKTKSSKGCLEGKVSRFHPLVSV